MPLKAVLCDAEMVFNEMVDWVFALIWKRIRIFSNIASKKTKSLVITIFVHTKPF